MIEKRKFELKQPLVIIIAICLFNGLNAQAQNNPFKRTKDQVVARAIEVAPLIKSNTAQSGYFSALSANRFDPAKATFKADYGKVNSAFNDSKYLFEQTFDFTFEETPDTILNSLIEHYGESLPQWRDKYIIYNWEPENARL